MANIVEQMTHNLEALDLKFFKPPLWRLLFFMPIAFAYLHTNSYVRKYGSLKSYQYIKVEAA